MSDYRWPLTHDLYLYLALAGSDGLGRTGEVPQVAIKRVQNIEWSPSDGRYWDNSGSFVANVTFNDMTEEDLTNNPGLYSYIFSQSFIYYNTDYV